MQQPVDAEAIDPVYRLGLAHNEGPSPLFVHLSLVILVLQRRKHDHPEAMEQNGNVVVLGETEQTVVIELQCNLKSRSLTLGRCSSDGAIDTYKDAEEARR